MLLVLFLIAITSAGTSEGSEPKFSFQKSGHSSRCLIEIYEVERKLYLISSRISQAASDAKRLNSLVNQNFIVNVLDNVVNSNIGGNIGINVGTSSLNNVVNLNDVQNTNINDNSNTDYNYNDLINKIYDDINVLIRDPEKALFREEGDDEINLSINEDGIEFEDGENYPTSTSKAEETSCNNGTKQCTISQNFNLTSPIIVRETEEIIPIVIPSPSIEEFIQMSFTATKNKNQNMTTNQDLHEMNPTTTLVSDGGNVGRPRVRNNSKRPLQALEPTKLLTTMFPIYLNVTEGAKNY